MISCSCECNTAGQRSSHITHLNVQLMTVINTWPQKHVIGTEAMQFIALSLGSSPWRRPFNWHNQTVTSEDPEEIFPFAVKPVYLLCVCVFDL